MKKYCEKRPTNCDCMDGLCGVKRKAVLSKATNRFTDPERPLLIISEAELLAIKKNGKLQSLLDFCFEIRSTAQAINLVSKTVDIKILPN